MTNTPMKTCLSSLLIKEIQVILIRYHLSPIKLAKIFQIVKVRESDSLIHSWREYIIRTIWLYV